jgi:Uma2 family endonuclease
MIETVSTSRRVLRRPATLADLLSLPPDVAAEVVAGELIEKALPTFEHGDAQAEITTQLRGRFGGPPRDGGGGWWIAAEVDVQYGEEVFRHDVVGWRRDQSPQRPSGRPVRVRPDWVCEVLSPSNASTDTVRKLRTLHAHAVPHYWLADPDRRTLTVLRWQEAGYLTILNAEAGEIVRAEPFETLELRTGPIFGDD